MAKNGRGCKNKGSAFERELADYLSQRLGLNIRRTPLSGSVSMVKGIGSADLTGTPGLWVEAKRTERLSPHEFMDQARRGATAHGNVDMPVVITRRNKQSLDDALVLMSLKDFTELYRRWLHSVGYRLPSLVDGSTPPQPGLPPPDPNQSSFPF